MLFEMAESSGRLYPYSLPSPISGVKANQKSQENPIYKVPAQGSYAVEGSKYDDHVEPTESSNGLTERPPLAGSESSGASSNLLQAELTHTTTIRGPFREVVLGFLFVLGSFGWFWEVCLSRALQ